MASESMQLCIGDRSWELAPDIADTILGAAEVWESPSDTLRRLLQADGKVSPDDGPSDVANRRVRRGRQTVERDRGRHQGEKRPRARSGTILPEPSYDVPMLEALVEAGGRAPKSEVIDAVGQKVAEILTPVDREMLGNEERWKKRIQFRRLKLVEQGLIMRGSPRGIWEITDRGEAKLAEMRSREAAK